jgi:hypothetical protein
VKAVLRTLQGLGKSLQAKSRMPTADMDLIYQLTYLKTFVVAKSFFGSWNAEGVWRREFKFSSQQFAQDFNALTLTKMNSLDEYGLHFANKRSFNVSGRISRGRAFSVLS